MPKRRALVVLALSLAMALSGPAQAGLCQRLLWLTGISSVLEHPIVADDGLVLSVPSSGEGVLANGVAISGPDDFPLSVIQHHLGLDKTDKPKIPGKVLSIGEGYSCFLPALVDGGTDVKAVDLWYGNPRFPDTYEGKQMAAFDKKYRDRLIRGSATKLPVEDKSYDFVVSHQLVNNVPADVQKTMTLEAVRVVAPGGEARIFGYKEADARAAADAVKEKYGDAVTVKLERLASEFFHPYVGRVAFSGWLLVATRSR